MVLIRLLDDGMDEVGKTARLWYGSAILARLQAIGAIGDCAERQPHDVA